ncbi:putative methylase, partial [Mytilus galloprovincialis]
MNIPCMKPSKFHQALSHIDNEFRDLKILLEQYPTDIPTTHELIYLIQSQYGDIEEKMIADLGCGVGVLGIGAALLGASYVLGIDIDQDALELCQENIETLDLENIDLLQLDVTNLIREHSSSTVESESSESVKDCSSISGKFHKCFDTVIMNPPFGTKNSEGIDMKFVQIALDMANNS